MRINAGIYKRRNIYTCNLETTRETSDMVRQAMFNLLGQYFENITVLDLFAGSGALGLEALSRGASIAFFNDLNKQALNTVKKNIETLKIENDKVKLYNLDYKELLKKLDQNLFDIIFLDPPYKMNNIKEILKDISDAKILKDNGKIVFEMAKETTSFESDLFNIIQNRTYGIKRVVIYEKVK